MLKNKTKNNIYFFFHYSKKVEVIEKAKRWRLIEDRSVGNRLRLVRQTLQSHPGGLSREQLMFTLNCSYTQILYVLEKHRNEFGFSGNLVFLAESSRASGAVLDAAPIAPAAPAEPIEPLAACEVMEEPVVDEVLEHPNQQLVEPLIVDEVLEEPNQQPVGAAPQEEDLPNVCQYYNIGMQTMRYHLLINQLLGGEHDYRWQAVVDAVAHRYFVRWVGTNNARNGAIALFIPRNAYNEPVHVETGLRYFHERHIDSHDMVIYSEGQKN